MSLTIHYKYKYFDTTVQRAEDRRQNVLFLPFAVNVKLNLSIHTQCSACELSRLASLPILMSRTYYACILHGGEKTNFYPNIDL